MPHTRDVLRLEPVPASVALARDLVAEHLRGVDREDLVESAELVVSELVTNALLHGRSPITLRVRGTHRHPRVEVGDRSPDLPSLPRASLLTGAAAEGGDGPRDEGAPPAADTWDLEHLSTNGRGIHMVISHSLSWGIDRTSSSKVVWFEPSPEPRRDGPTEPRLFDISETGATTGTAGAGGDRVAVRLLHSPVRSIALIRRHSDDLMREIRLISLQYGSEAADLPQRLFNRGTRPSLDRLRRTADELWPARREAPEHADVDFHLSRQDAEVFAHGASLLLEADDFCRDQQLLSLALTPRLRAIVEWLSDQVTGQVAGSCPTPWDEEPFEGD